MNRRGFLKFLGAGVAAGVAVRTFPFRVYSFPSEIKRFTLADLGYLEWNRDSECWYLNEDQAIALEQVREQLPALINGKPNEAWLKAFGDETYPRRVAEGRLIMQDPDGKSLGVGSGSSFLPAPKGEPFLRVPFARRRLLELTEGIEQQDLLLRDVEAPAASWKRKLLRA